MTEVKCPNCGASFPVNQDNIRSVMFCSHCGTRISDFDDLLKKTIEQSQQLELKKQVREQELAKYEAEMRVDTRKEIRSAAASGVKEASKTTIGCLASILALIGSSVLYIVISLGILAVCIVLFIKFLPEILDLMWKLFSTIFGGILHAIFK